MKATEQRLEEIQNKSQIKAKCETNLYEFIKYCWPAVEPETPFIGSWVIRAICLHLEAVARGEIPRLNINVFPGSMKPVHVDEPVMTARGPRRLGDIQVGEMVLTHKGRFRRVSAVHIQGELPTLTIKTWNGRSIRAAPDHPFLTARGWMPASQILPHDVLGAIVPQEAFGRGDEVTDEEARFLGYLIGDGSLKYTGITFTNMQPDVISDFISCARALGFNVLSTQQKNTRALRLAVSSNRDGSLQRFIEKHGLKGKDSYTKTVPPAVKRASPQIIRNFLGAYWSCDGYLGVRHQGAKTSHIAKLTSVSRTLLEECQYLMMLVGISTRVRQHRVKLETQRQPGGVYVSYDLSAGDEHNVSKIAQLEGLSEAKRIAVIRSGPRYFDSGIFSDDVVSVEPDADGECRCLTVEEDSSFTANGVAVHNSLLCAVFFPAWLWGPQRRPHLRFLCFAYAAYLTERDNRRFRDLVLSDRYREMWGDAFTVLNPGVGQIINDRSGWKLASSVGGVGTGERGDVVIIDDANRPPTEADPVGESNASLRSTAAWFREILPDRLNSLERSVIINIQQRVSDLDVTGIILDLGLPYDFLSIPMLLDTMPDRSGARRPIIETSLGWFDPRMREDWFYVEEDPEYDPVGEMVDEDELTARDGIPADLRRFPLEQLEELRQAKGAYAWASQYMQLVNPRGGGIILGEWWEIWHGRDFPEFGTCVASLDTAFKQHEEADFNALVVMAAFEHPETLKPKLMLRAAWQERCSLPVLAAKVIASCREHKVDILLVEDSARGPDAVDEIERLMRRGEFQVILIRPVSDKVARLHATVPLFENGIIYAPDTDWAEMLMRQVAHFPRASHDDLVDALSMLLIHVRKTGVAVRREEFDEDVLRRRTFRKEPVAAYDV